MSGVPILGRGVCGFDIAASTGGTVVRDDASDCDAVVANLNLLSFVALAECRLATA
jgi:hypothetical protein